MKNFISSKNHLILAFSLLFNLAVLSAQEQFAALETNVAPMVSTASPQSIFDELVDEPQLKITLESDFSNLIEKKNDDEYQAALMTYANDQGEQIQKELRIKARGKFRRKICDFPPLKLKFYKDDLAEAGFNPAYKSFKLVTHCLDDEENKQNVLKEYLAYKLYNQLTPESFQVKLVEVTYLDNVNGEEPTVRYGFLIENTKELSHRLGGEKIEEYNMGLDVMDTNDRKIFSMFQFMIGNTDWKTNIMHNIKIIKSDASGETMMIPYDFDFAGLINTSYARPNVDVKQTSVLQRVYMDKVNKLEELDDVIRYFKKNKKAFYSIVENMDELSKKNKRSVLRYLNSFYSILNSAEKSRLAFVSESL